VTFVDARNLPRHVAIIMDGNGRWAESRGLARTQGHRAGSRAVRRVVTLARRLGVRALTLFAFSEQNWGRPEHEVEALMDLLHEYLLAERDEILSNGIRLRAIGDVARLPTHVRDVLDGLASVSAANNAMTLSLALSYGGREEVVAAVQNVARRVARGDVRPDEIDEAMVAHEIPSVSVGDPDLLIRTGGEIRISNFLLWGAAYSELHFSPVLWPEFGAEDLFVAIAAYQQRQRRFGLVSGRCHDASLEATSVERSST